MARGWSKCVPWGRAPGGPICGGPTQERAGAGSAQRPGPQGDPAQSALAGQIGTTSSGHGVGSLGRQGVLPTGSGSSGGRSRAGPSFQVIPGKGPALRSWMSICRRLPKHNLPCPPLPLSRSRWSGQDGGWLPRPGPPQAPSPGRAGPGAWDSSTH